LYGTLNKVAKKPVLKCEKIYLVNVFNI